MQAVFVVITCIKTVGMDTYDMCIHTFQKIMAKSSWPPFTNMKTFWSRHG